MGPQDNDHHLPFTLKDRLSIDGTAKAVDRIENLLKLHIQQQHETLHKHAREIDECVKKSTIKRILQLTALIVTAAGTAVAAMATLGGCVM